MSLVTVIIPTYNVEQFLRSCLESLQAQTHQDLQVLIVDDESTDASPYIAQQFADRDSRFRHIWQANRGPGPGGGRNGGLPFVEGEWIFFLDGDDLIPPDAIEKLGSVGNRTGSDIVTGNVSRFDGAGPLWPTSNHARSHQVALEQTHILRHPMLAYDSTAWNKLYRTEFWNGAGRTFPERKLFEDINPITRAHCESASTDVITDVVYHWRIRDDQSSITQQVADARTFGDKIEQLTLAHQYLCDHNYDAVRAVFEEKALTRDFLQGVDDVASGDDDYAKLVCTQGAEFLERMLPSSIEAVPLRDQLKFYLARHGRLDDLRDLLTGAYDRASHTLHADPGGLRAVNNFAAALQPAVPDDLTISENQPAVTLSRVYMSWEDESLVVSATAAIPGLGGRLHKVQDVHVFCEHPVYTFDVAADMRAPFDAGLGGMVDWLQVDRANRRVRIAPDGRFRVNIPLAELAPPPAMDFVQWHFGVRCSASGLVRSTRLPPLNGDRLPQDRTREQHGSIYELSSDDDVTLTVRRTP